MTLSAAIISNIIADTLQTESALIWETGFDLSDLDESKGAVDLQDARDCLDDIRDGLISEYGQPSDDEWACCQEMIAWKRSSFARHHLGLARERIADVGDEEARKLIDNAIGSMDAVIEHFRKKYPSEKCDTEGGAE